MVSQPLLLHQDSLLARSHIRSNLEDDGDRQGDTGSVSNSSKDKANEKLAECETVDEDMQVVENEILTELIGKERCGRVRGVGLGPTPKTYYGGTTSRNYTASRTQSSDFAERFQQMEQQMQQMQEERDQERAQREQERDQERTRYNALLGFLQSRFPGVSIPGVDIAGSTSQSQDQPSGDQ